MVIAYDPNEPCRCGHALTDHATPMGQMAMVLGICMVVGCSCETYSMATGAFMRPIADEEENGVVN